MIKPVIVKASHLLYITVGQHKHLFHIVILPSDLEPNPGI